MGFYQLEDDTLHIPLGGVAPSKRFFSYIDSPISRFDIDKKGRLVFIELTLPKRFWKKSMSLPCPDLSESAEIRWLDFRKTIGPPEIITDSSNSVVLIVLSDEIPAFTMAMADNVYLQVSDRGNACGVLVSKIIEDNAGRKLAEFRRELKAAPDSTSQSVSSVNSSSTVS